MSDTDTHGVNDRNRVVVVDFDMPFMSMVRFMVKWAIAAIPAAVILGLIVGLTLVVTLGGSGVLGRLLSKDNGSVSDATGTSAKTDSDPAGIAGSGKIYLDGPNMQYHEPGCPEVAKLASPMQYDREAAVANGYRPHTCVR